MASELGGVWRTIRGRRVFIKDGEDLATAMERSGKFKKTSDISREEYQRNRDNIDLDNRLKKDINNTDFDDKTLEIDKRIDVRNNAREYTGDTSKLEGKHIAGRESKAREIDKINKISKEEYDNMPKDYKGTLKELVDTAEFRGESKEKERQYWESKGYDVDKDKTILKYENGGTTLQPVKIDDKYDEDKLRETKYNSVVDRYNKDENFRNMLKSEHDKSIETTKKEISSYFDMTKEDRESLVGGQEDLYKAINEDYGNINKEEFDRLYRTEELKRDLSRPYIEQPDGTYADPKSPFTKRTSTELRKQIKELEPYTEELQVGNRVIINTGGGRYGVRNVGDEDDPMTDYSAYVYGFNAKSIIQRAREQGIVTDAPKTSKTTEAKVERFKERKGKTLDTMSKRQLAEKIVDDQIARGVIKSDNKELQIKRKMQDYSKSDLLDYFK